MIYIRFVARMNSVAIVLALWGAALGASEAAVLGQVAPDLSACIAQLRGELPIHATIRIETFDALTANVQDLRPVIETATQSQPEFKLAIWDYVARLADAQRAVDGREILARQTTSLEIIARRHGVDPATVVSVFGVETDYGRARGRYPVVDATLSRACLKLDNQERKDHFFAALWLVQQGLVARDNFRGSWAGAFGLTQFMPGTFVRYMEAADGSSHPDIIGNPADALATTARFLRGLGWVPGLRWGIEVSAPRELIEQWNALQSQHACLTTSSNVDGSCKLAKVWKSLGVVPRASIDEASWPTTTQASLFAPTGPDGPVWLVSQNFHALWQYNRADAYALSIGLLSDALRGEPPAQLAWPTDDLPIGRIEFRELQTLLSTRGHDVVPDGLDGPQTQQAIRDEQRILGLEETGRGGQKLLGALRNDASAPTNVTGTAQSPPDSAKPNREVQ